MKILVRDSLPTAIVKRLQSSSVIVPVLKRLESTLPELQIIRVANWSAPISSEKIPTVYISSCVATFCAIFKAKAVLPTEGRAARMIKSLRLKPAVIWSKSR